MRKTQGKLIKIIFVQTLVVIMYSVLLAGCATETMSIRLDESLNFYGSSIRWGDFEGAKKFYKDQQSWSDVDFPALKSIKITSYNVRTRTLTTDGAMLLQTVHILYYDTNFGQEREITDKQTWEYDEEREVWMLLSAFPKF